MAKMKEGSRKYIKEAIHLACSRIDIYTCQNCGHPVEHGYCCGHCKSDDPVAEHQDKFYIDDAMPLCD
jgi:hypothetical protein